MECIPPFQHSPFHPNLIHSLIFIKLWGTSERMNTTAMLIDSHCHLDHPAFDSDRTAIIGVCNKLHIGALILPGVTTTGWRLALTLSHQHPSLYTALGLHPLFSSQHPSDGCQQLEQQLQQHPEVVAVGEIGLDYYPKNYDRALQQQLFSNQLLIAGRYHKPLLLHVRKAHQQVLELLKQQSHYGGIVHAFSGSYEQASEYIDAGFLIGVGGVVTRPNAHKLHRVVQQIPLSSIALETDAPDLPPSWAQGERNSPLHLPQIAQQIADIRGQPTKEVIEQTTHNVQQCLRLNVD